jgi:hypothetical protein
MHSPSEGTRRVSERAGHTERAAKRAHRSRREISFRGASFCPALAQIALSVGWQKRLSTQTLIAPDVREVSTKYFLFMFRGCKVKEPLILPIPVRKG